MPTDNVKTFYVAKNGNDGWSGTLPAPDAQRSDGPFATLTAARDAIRVLKSGSDLMVPVIVYVRGGKHFLPQTLIFGPEDSGTQDCPITYTAFPGEEPILSGGRIVTDWKPFRGDILQCELPGAKGGKWKFRQLFFDGQRQIRSRWPKLDPDNHVRGAWLVAEGPADDGSNRCSSFTKLGFLNGADARSEGGVDNSLRYRKGSLPKHWGKPTEAEVNIFTAGGWLNELIPIKSINEEERIITLAREQGPWDRSPWFVKVSFMGNNRFIVENLLEELNQPGEWCLDSEDGILYYWPPCQDIARHETVIPVLDCLMALRGTQWIDISGLTFTQTLDGDDYQRDGVEGLGAMFPHQGRRYCGEALHLKRVSHCTIEDNHFHAVGGNAIYLEGYNERNVVRHNEISYAGANGVCLAGSRNNKQHPMFNRIEDNHIHHCGVILKYVAGVAFGLSDGNVVAHNSIHDMPHHAINLGNSGYGRNIIEYNEIRRVDLEISDSGAINCWMEDPDGHCLPYAERSGHIIRYNLVEDVPGCNVDADGNIVDVPGLTSGVYLDNCTSNCLVHGNVFVRTGKGIFVHAGRII